MLVFMYKQGEFVAHGSSWIVLLVVYYSQCIKDSLLELSMMIQEDR